MKKFIEQFFSWQLDLIPQSQRMQKNPRDGPERTCKQNCVKLQDIIVQVPIYLIVYFIIV